MQRAEADFRKQFATPEEFNNFLQSDFHGSRELMLEKIRRSLLIEAFLKTEVEAKSVVSPAEVRGYYDKNPVRFHHPETFTFQTITVLPPANATEAQLKEARTRAENALRPAKATKTAEEFGLLAEKISDDDYRVMMGQHKPLPVDQLAPQVAKAFNSDAPERHERPDPGGTGVHDCAAAGAHARGTGSFLEVKAQLLKELQQTKTNQIRAELDQRLRKNAKIDAL